MAQDRDDLKAAAAHIADVGRLRCIRQSPNEGSSGNVRAVYAQPITIEAGEAVEVDTAEESDVDIGHGGRHEGRGNYTLGILTKKFTRKVTVPRAL
jgi:hypothetical protein